MFEDFSSRAAAVTLRTYCRPKDDEGTSFESWPEVIQRSTYDHHLRLWDSVNKNPNLEELDELTQLGLDRKSLVSGRTLWLGGTEYSYSRPACNFNCAAIEISTVYDLVDGIWLLLNGSGVGFSPRVGCFHGYIQPIPEIEVIPSTRDKDWKGTPENKETLPSAENNYTWTIVIGDSAQAWSKAFGKLVAPRSIKAKKLVIDGSNVRGPGGRLKGYGWICNGFAPLGKALVAIHHILNRKAANLLDEIDLLDIFNLAGEVLSSRRSAEICELDSTNPNIETFKSAKYKYWLENPHRRQSNNSVGYWFEPSYEEILDLLMFADECGGDPALINMEGWRNKCPWFILPNPCVELGLASAGFCNLVTNCLPRFRKNFYELERAIYLIARANYRQTCVNHNDGVLQPKWHQNNESLRLCGASLTGICQADWLTDYQIRRLEQSAVYGAYSMADEFHLPRPKGICTGKPEGTGSKAMGSEDVGEILEGLHRSLGKYIKNWINFSVHDPLVALYESSGYKVLPNPNDSANVLVCFPIEYKGVKFDKVNGKEVNLESAEKQMDRYLRWNNLWAHYNMSCTISYSPEELPGLAKKIKKNWHKGFIATSFLRRNDPTKTAKDLGHPYLPQEVVSEEEYLAYKETLRPVDLSSVSGIYDLDSQECPGGVCPVR